MRVRWFLILFALTACCHTLRPGAPLDGTVVDPKGAPVVHRRSPPRQRPVAMTRADGAFALPYPPRERVAVTVRARGFTTTTKVLAARAAGGGTNVVVVWPRAAAQRIRSSDGGRLTFPGATVAIPPNAFVDARGARIAGDVDVALTAVDLNNRRQLEAAPGDFTARMQDGSIRRLETFGLFELAAESNGRAVELARGMGATVQLDLRRGARELVPAFSFDTVSGLWIQQPKPWQGATFTAGSTGWWNADDPLTTTCIRVQVLDCKLCDAADTIVSGATVSATGTDYTGAVTSDTTQQLTGIACLFVKASAHVVLKVEKTPRAGESVEVATPSMLSSTCDQNCPLTVLHLNDAAITAQAPLDDATAWCATNDRANGSPFDTVWSSSAPFVSASPSSVALTIAPCTLPNCHNQPYASGEYKSRCFHGYGLYTVTITPPAQQWDTTLSDSKIKGLDAAFFTYTDSGDGTVGDGIPNWHDEIDIELLGRKPGSGDYLPNATTPGGCTNDHDLVVHTNYFAKDHGGHERDYCVSYTTHAYTFNWSNAQIVCTIDGGPLRTEPRATSGPARDDWPTQPGRVFMNLWGNATNAAWAGGPYGYTQPETATFTGVTAPP